MKFTRGTYTTTQVIFKPHALNTLFELDARLLTEGFMNLVEISGKSLNEQLLNASSETDRLALLTQFLVSRQKGARKIDAVVEASLRMINNSVDSITVRQLLEMASMSERQFEKRFSQVIGIAPSSYIRLKRFKKAVQFLKTGRTERLTDIAHTLNYYDQSHFIRDIKAFSGMTPKKLAQRQGDFYHEQAGYSYT